MLKIMNSLSSCSFVGKQLKIRMFRRGLHKILIVIEQLLDYRLFLVLPLFTSLDDENGDDKREAEHLHHMAQRFPRFEG